MLYRCGWCDGEYVAAEFYWKKDGQRIARCKTCVKSIAAAKKEAKRAGRKCKACGEPVPFDKSGKAKFCTKQCKALWDSMRPDRRIVKSCDWCGDEFSTSPGWADRRRFCCRSCMTAAQWPEDKAARDARVAAMDRKCPNCGVAVPVGKQANARHCSTRCSHATNQRSRNHSLRAGNPGRGYEQISKTYLGDRDGWKCGGVLQAHQPGAFASRSDVGVDRPHRACVCAP